MYIKQVVIKGFKSFKDETIIETFHKGHNVVYGNNGAGKSNFFAALQFVISDEYTHLNEHQRLSLLYEGPGHDDLSASVTIIFDNTDKRICRTEDNIVLQRVIGANTDKYQLNNKIVTRKYVFNLFETAGFSVSNPFYIIKQGQINEVAMASEASKLCLLESVAGVKIYEERILEVTKDFEVIDGKIEMLDKYVLEINAKLATAETELREYKANLLHDKNRQMLEFLINKAELVDTRSKLEKLECEREEIKNKKVCNRLEKENIEYKICKNKVISLKKEISQLEDIYNTLNNKHHTLLKDKIKLTFEITDLNIDELNKTEGETSNKLNAIKCEMQLKQIELDKMQPIYDELKEKTSRISSELSVKMQKRDNLYRKLGRGQQFKSKNERNNWIKKELDYLNKQIELKSKEFNELEKNASERAKLNNTIAAHEIELGEAEASIKSDGKSIDQLVKMKRDKSAELSELQRQANEINLEIVSKQQDLKQRGFALRRAFGKGVILGCESIQKVLNTFKARGGKEAELLNSYHGLLIDCFDCADELYTAVDVVGQSRLYYHIIDNDIVATKILQEMNNQNLPGEVHFMAINRLVVPITEYPKHDDGYSLYSQLVHDAQYEKPIRYIFGRFMLCRSIKVAKELGKKCLLNCVTLDGDQVSSQGVMSGGYYNPRHSKMNLHYEYTKVEKQVKQDRQKLELITRKLSETATQAEIASSDILEIRNTIFSFSRLVCDQIKRKIQFANEKLNNMDNNQALMEKCNADLSALRECKRGLETELQEELLSSLSGIDQIQITTLSKEIKVLNDRAKKITTKLMEVDNHKTEYNNLKRKSDHYSTILSDILKKHEEENRLNDWKNEICLKIVKVSQELKDFEQKTKLTNEALVNESAKLLKHTQQVDKLQAEMDEDLLKMDTICAKEIMLKKKMSNFNFDEKNIDLNSELYQNYIKLSMAKLYKEIKRESVFLKEYSFVNNKCKYNHQFLTNEKNESIKAIDNFKKENLQIKDILKLLAEQKKDAIKFTFIQISQHFETIFRKLVPTGRGKLLMGTMNSPHGKEIGAEPEDNDPFTGIVINVTFVESDAGMCDIKQLSGGQKSVVALSLIFAIQKSDSAPFYLLDETDQALDQEYRSSLANMIHELSKDVQFITTTFRPELLERADQFYEVTHHNMSSHLQLVSKEVATQFIYRSDTINYTPDSSISSIENV